MIFVTVGTHDQPFDRLLAGMDGLTEEYDKEVVAQVGHSDYQPKDMEWFSFVSESEINEYYRDATVVVGHAGAGTILMALSYGKPIVLVPRREDRDEHLDDHQLELTEALQDREGIFVVDSTDDLRSAIDSALDCSRTTGRATGELLQYFSANLERMVD